MRTALALTIGFLLAFCAMTLVAINSEPHMPGAQATSLALEWTIHLFGGIVAVAAAVGMLLVAAGHGAFRRQIMLTLPLLAGLMLIGPNWGLALALGSIAVVWIYRFGANES